MATVAELEDALKNADAAATAGVPGAAEDARALADELVKLTGAPKARSKDYMRGRSEAGGATRGAMSVLNGPTLGFGDELLGALGGAWDTIRKGGSFSDNYAANRDYVRGAQDVEQETNPITTGVTQAMASAPMTLLKLPGTAQKVAQTTMGVLPQMGRSAASGAFYGAAGGMGNSTEEDLSGVVRDGAKGGVSGAAIGGAITPVARAVGAVGGNVASRFRDSAATRYANEKIAEAISRDATANVFRSGMANPADAMQRRLQRLGPNAVLADAAGENTRQLLDTMATLPGATKDAAASMIRNRQAGRGARMIDSAEAAMGTGGARLSSTVDGLIQARARASKPLYDALKPVVIPFASPRLQEVVTAAHALGAASLGKKSATARLQNFTLNPEQPFNWKLTDLDNLKRGLDTMIEKEVTPLGRSTSLGVDVLTLKQALVQELDDLTVDPRTGQSIYKAARDAFSGPSALITAARQGSEAMSGNEASIRAVTRGMTPSELHAFRIGAFESLRNKLGGSDGGRTEVMNMWKNVSMQEKLKAMFGTERNFRQFAADVARETRMKMLDGVGQGSKTAARQFAIGDLDTAAIEGVGSAVHGVAKGNPLTALAGARNAWNSVKTPEAVRDRIGEVLLSAPPQSAVNLQAIRETVRRINEARGNTARGMGLMGGAFGAPAFSVQ